MAKKLSINTIIVSRPDAIGDVMLTLPMCGIIKTHYPSSKIIFLGKTYTKDIINCCEHVDGFLNADDLFQHSEKDAVDAFKKINADAIIHVFPNKQLAKLSQKAGIKYRIGTTNRLFHWGVLNTLVPLSRKNSQLHEAQLNTKLLEALGIENTPTLQELASFMGFTNIPTLNKEQEILLDKTKINVVLHPKSNASAREWSLENYSALIQLLPSDKYQVFISGTEKEKNIINSWIDTLPEHVIDLTGKYSLIEFIAFIKNANYLVAASTGPLHIAAGCGIGAIGIYPPIKPMHPGRWQPIGEKAKFVCIDKSCNDCKKNPTSCSCINKITAVEVAQLLA